MSILSEQPLFEVGRVSPQVTVQDLGRIGFLHAGMPVSGAQDAWSLKVANHLVGNEAGGLYGVSDSANAAGLEILLPGLELYVLNSASVAITGGDLGPLLGGKPVPMWTALRLNKGDILTFRKLVTGLRSYLAVSGGVAVEPVLSSRATYLRGGIGGFQGRALMTGDIIAHYLRDERVPLRRLRSDRRPSYEQWTVRVVLGPQDHLYQDEAKEALATEAWTLLPDSDRMGFRFAGPTMSFKSSEFPEGYTPPFIVDDFIPVGGMQTPSEGLIIAMGVEGPSIGGYAKIATVISPDFSVLAQVRPGQVVKFLPVSWADAVSITLRTQQDLLGGELWEDVSEDDPNNA